MTYLSLTASLVAGVILVAINVVAAVCRSKTPQLKHGIQVFLMGPGAFGGVRMFWRCVATGELQLALEGDEKVYFMVGAISLVWISLQEGACAIKAMHT